MGPCLSLSEGRLTDQGQGTVFCLSKHFLLLLSLVQHGEEAYGHEIPFKSEGSALLCSATSRPSARIGEWVATGIPMQKVAYARIGICGSYLIM